MSFRLNPRPIILESEAPSVFSLVRSIDPSYNIEYRRYIQLADEMRAAVDQARAVSHAALPEPQPQYSFDSGKRCGGT